MLEKGTELAGYRIDGVLGQGGMGVVYEATQLSLDRRVALKLLAAHLGADPQFRERFRREALIQAAIDHPHIVTVYEAGEADEGLFISMRLVRGPNLKDMILSRELDAGRALRIITPVAEALDSAHEAGLIHRDIKPQNILVSGRDHAYLADFGLTKAPGEKSLTKTGQFVGTLDYISPEQIRGQKATAASDIYALAAVLYEALTGVVPFPKDSEAAVLFAHMSDAPPKVTGERPELPAGLDEVIAQAMSKNPEDRHTSALELLEDAERAFGRRGRAVISPPGPLEGPEEAGIRKPEGEVRTRESNVQRSDELASAGATEPGGPGETRLAGVEGTQVAGAAGETAVAGAADATKLGDTADATKLGDAADTTKLGEVADETRLTDAAGATRAGTPPSTPVPGAAESEPRRVPFVPIVAVVAIALAVVGFLVGSSGGEEKSEGPAFEPTSSAAAGSMKLSFPEGWRETTGAKDIPGLELKDQIVLAVPDSGGIDSAGLIAGGTDATGPTLLPSDFRRTLGTQPKPDDAVRLGELEAYRYRGLEPKDFDGLLTVYATQHAGGVATVACYAPSGPAGEATLARCEQVAATLELRDTEALGLGPDGGYAGALDGILRKLNSQRTAGRARLRTARTPAGQADSARRIAASYDDAAKALRKVTVPPAAADAHSSIVTALAQAETAYGRLASAARRGDRRAYSSARSAITRAEAAVQRGFDGLKALGYEIV